MKIYIFYNKINKIIKIKYSIGVWEFRIYLKNII